MGGSSSTEEKKTIDSTGAVNTNIVINDPVEVKNQEIIILLTIICVQLFLYLAIYVFTAFKKSLKKKYINNPA